ncbi:ATP-binding protein [Cereibacter sphaeroides]|uniref:ATP-binding protein n=1 Tax=Cereibacter sphaeroides TaxID=1063 RepID=UPI001F171808|nr:ATP-binding protein [Cereibacter sphaeroides]MCE6958536.1 ATP-binding protein [Cereibacter sphaeroides]MCE6972801.1 ATP-binding protein [Cereibacter sphaeroides]
MSVARHPLTPGLLRMVVVNTHLMRDRIEELPLDGHTAIIAKNQSGKTSLMKLLPFFLGALPREVQPPEKDHRNFVEFYLPTNASYIACEYVNANGQVRAVVVHTDPSKQTVQYRLVRSGLTLDMFLKRGDGVPPSFVLNADFEAHARAMGFSLNGRLITSTRDFKGIIQGRYPSGSTLDRATFAGLVEQFGLGRRSNPLDNIEQLFLTTIRNNFSITDLLSVVTNKVLDFSGRKIPILGGANSQENLSLVDDFRAYHGVMGMEPAFRDAETADTRRAEFDAALTSLLSKLMGSSTLAAREISELQERRSGLITAHRMAVAAMDEERAAAATARVEAEARINEARRGIEEIERIERVLREQNADKAGAQLARRPALEDRLEAILTELALQNRNRPEIEALHGDRVAAIRERERREHREIDDRRIEIARLVDGFKEGIRRSAAEQEEALRADHAKTLEILDAELETLSDRRERLQNALSEVIADTMAVAEQDRCATRVREAASELKQMTDSAARSDAEFRKAQTDLEGAERAALDAEKELHGLEARHRDIQARREPAPGSLQWWLERNVPGWRETIGLVIDERLLAKTNLDPAEAEGTSFYGVSLDHARIGGGCPTLEALEREQAEIADRKDRAELAVAALRKSTEQAAAARRKAMKLRDQDSAQAEIAAKAHAGALSSLDEATRAVEVSKDVQRADLRASLEELKGLTDSRRTQRAAAVAAHRAALTAGRERTEARLSAETRELVEEAARLADARSVLEKEIRTALAEADALRAAALADDRLPADRVRALMAEETDLRRALAAMPAAEALERKWTEFTSLTRPRRAEHEDAIPLLEQAREAKVREIAALEDRRKVATSAHEADIDRIDGRTRVLEGLKNRADMRLQTPGADIEAPEDLSGLDPAGIGDLLERIRDAEDERKKANRIIADKVRLLRNGFSEVNGRIRDLYRDRAKTLGTAPEGPRWLPIFAEWFDTGHETMWQTIRNQIGVVAVPILESSHRLHEIDKEIASVSRKLRNAIARLPTFPGVSDVDLSLRSRLRLEGFWRDMEEFVRQHDTWQRDPDVLDIDPLVDALERYLRNWPVGVIPEVDMRDQIFIEGQLREGNELRKLTRDTDLGKLSSEGGSSIIRLIILTAAIDLIRDKSDVRFTWCVDELGRLDRDNSCHLVDMLTRNNVTLVTGAPELNHDVRAAFANRIEIARIPGKTSTTLITVDATNTRRNGIREWDEHGDLVYPEGDR